MNVLRPTRWMNHDASQAFPVNPPALVSFAISAYLSGRRGDFGAVARSSHRRRGWIAPDANRETSRVIVEAAKTAGVSRIVMEDLTHIRARIKAGKRMRAKLHRWVFIEERRLPVEIDLPCWPVKFSPILQRWVILPPQTIHSENFNTVESQRNPVWLQELKD